MAEGLKYWNPATQKEEPAEGIAGSVKVGPPTLALQYDGSGVTTLYLAEAAPGTPNTSATGWRIRKIVTGATSCTIQWPNGDASFSYSWANRASYTYA